MAENGKVRIVTVTPEMAKEWLAKNLGNRSLSHPHIAFLVDEMKNDRFGLSNDAIAFNTKGELINGQHRLTAVMQSGVACQFLVVAEVDDEMKERLDLGRSRSVPDMLKMLYGVDRARLVTGSIRLLDEFVDNRKIKLSVGHALNQIARYKPAFDWACKDLPGRSQFICAPSVAAFVYAHRSEAASVEAFARQVVTGVNLPEFAPALAFRHFVLDHRGLFACREDKRECFLVCLSAIEKFMRGGRVKKLKRNDSIVESFSAVYAKSRRAA